MQKNSRPTHINEVKIQFLEEDSREYSDPAEPELLEIFTSKNPKEAREKVLNNSPTWPLYYHLSDVRSNVVSWIEFEKNAKVLEIGAGCGSITEELVKQDVSVTANDISWKRCEVNAHRNKNAKNLDIVVGNLEKYKPKEKFDYIVCIGVLEYAGSFISGPKPYETFIKNMRKFLKDDGIFIVAIENKLGFKYISGAREDHTSTPFDGLNDYIYSKKKVKTFGREELSNLIKSQFSFTQFYYPYPDYKLPSMVFSDYIYPGHNFRFPLGILPTPNPDQSRFNLFNEKTFVNTLQENGLYRDFSNSFIVFASSKKLEKEFAFTYFQNFRPVSKKITTTINKHGETFKVTKKSVDPEYAQDFSTSMLNNYKMLLGKTGSKIELSKPTLSAGNSIEMKFHEGDSLESIFTSHLIRKDTVAVAKLIEEYIDAINALDKKTLSPATQKQFHTIFGNSYGKNVMCSIGSLDMNFDNFIVNGDRWYFFDYEWTFNLYIPTEYIIGRTLFWEILCRYPDLFDSLSTDNKYRKVLGVKIPQTIYKVVSPYLSKDSLDRILGTEEKFQEYVSGGTRTALTKKAGNKIAYDNLDDLKRFEHLYKTEVSKLKKDLVEREGELAAARQELELIKSSKGYKFVEKVRSTIR